MKALHDSSLWLAAANMDMLVLKLHFWKKNDEGAVRLNIIADCIQYGYARPRSIYLCLCVAMILGAWCGRATENFI